MADAREPPHIQRHREWIFGGGRKRDPDPALGLQLTDKPAALGRHQRAGARMREAIRDIDGGALRATGLELGDDLKNCPTGQRMKAGSRKRGSSPGSH